MRAVLITGASRGIGRATALAFAKSGGFDAIVLVSRTENGSLEALAAEIGGINSGLRVITSYGNAGDREFINGLHDRLTRDAVRVELLINNAAVSYVEPVKKAERHGDILLFFGYMFKALHKQSPRFFRFAAACRFS